MRYFPLIPICLALLITACGREPIPREQRLLESIQQVETAAQERSLSGIMDYISHDYQDNQGLQYSDIKRLVQVQILRYRNLYILSDINQIEWLSPDQARVDISIAVAGRPIKDVSLLKNIRADIINFELMMQADGDRFMVRSAQWRRGGLTDFL